MQPVVAVGEEVNVVRLVVLRLLQTVSSRRLGLLLLGGDIPLLGSLAILGRYSVMLR